MSRPQNHDQQGLPVCDGRGRLTEREREGALNYRNQEKSDEKFGTMKIGKHRLWEGFAIISLVKGDGDISAIKHIPADTAKGIPEYDLAELHGVKIHLRDGIKPDADGMLKGRVEVNVRIVQSKQGIVHYLSINIFPCDDEPEFLVGTFHKFPEIFEGACIDHWGADFNRSNVFVAALSSDL